MDTRQEIEYHEQELKGLLTRVLKDPLEPMHERLNELGAHLEMLEGQVRDDYVGGLSALNLGLDDVNKRLRKLGSTVEDVPRAFNASLGPLLDGVVEKLTLVQSNALKTMHTQLALDDNVRDQSLRGAMTEQLAQQDRRYVELLACSQDDSAKHASRLQHKTATELDYSMTGVGQRLAGLEAVMSRVEAVSQALEHGQTDWQEQQKAWQEKSLARSQDHLAGALRPLRIMLAGAMTLGGISVVGVVVLAIRLFS